MLKLTRPIAILDLETTDPEPVTAAIVEFGVVVLNPDGTTKSWEKRFKPWKPITDGAAEVTGITNEMVADCPPFSDFAATIHRGLQGKDLAGFNVKSFDLVCLDQNLRMCGLQLDLTGVNVIDAFSIFQKKAPRNLSAAVEIYCGRKHEDAHGALADSAATLDVIHGQLKAHEDLAAMSIEELAVFSKRDDVDYVDLAQKLYRRDGFVYYGFGKNRDQRLKDEPGFARWMLGKDFSGSTLDAVRVELERWGL